MSITFEPVNNEGCVFLQFMHYDFEKGMKAKKQIEWLFFLTQLLILVLFITVVIVLLYSDSAEIVVSSFYYYIHDSFIKS